MKEDESMEVILRLFAVQSILDFIGPFSDDFGTNSKYLYSSNQSRTWDGVILINDGLIMSFFTNNVYVFQISL